VRDEESAVEVVGLMAEGAGEQALAGHRELLAMAVEGADSGPDGAANLLAKAWHAEAALLLDLLALGGDDLRISQHQLRFGVFSAGDVNDGDVARDADLRRGQADSLGCVHGLEHVLDELLQFGIEARDGSGFFCEDFVTEFDDGVDHLWVIPFERFPLFVARKPFRERALILP
jgi:hypothetical protein